MVDWISYLGEETIDLLKIDIEGGEYEVLADPRFSALRIKILVMEWHQVNLSRFGRDWCIEKLEHMGFRTNEPHLIPDSDVDMIWAMKPE